MKLEEYFGDEDFPKNARISLLLQSESLCTSVGCNVGSTALAANTTFFGQCSVKLYVQFFFLHSAKFKMIEDVKEKLDVFFILISLSQ